MLMGAAHLLAMDTLTRSLAATETRLATLTAFLGAPVYLWLLGTGRGNW